MKRNFFTAVSGIALSSFIFSSCDTPTGAGAGYGAAAGAIIGGAATGHARGAAIGAAAGAATGALIGHSIQEERARAYGPLPREVGRSHVTPIRLGFSAAHILGGAMT